MLMNEASDILKDDIKPDPPHEAEEPSHPLPIIIISRVIIGLFEMIVRRLLASQRRPRNNLCSGNSRLFGTLVIDWVMTKHKICHKGHIRWFDIFLLFVQPRAIRQSIQFPIVACCIFMS